MVMGFGLVLWGIYRGTQTGVIGPGAGTPKYFGGKASSGAASAAV
jgi:hypothetical protein